MNLTIPDNTDVDWGRDSCCCEEEFIIMRCVDAGLAIRPPKKHQVQVHGKIFLSVGNIVKCGKILSSVKKY